MRPLIRPDPLPYSPYAPIGARRGARARRWASTEIIPTTPAEREAEIARIGRQLAKVARTLSWGRVQNDAWDGLCPYIFRLRVADSLRQRAEETARERLPEDERSGFVGYALRRWYCFWGARLAELIFQGYPNVQPGPPKDHEVDFRIDGVPFDLKTSEVPRAFADRLPAMLADPARAASWLYANQSRQRRFHAANRLFLLLCDPQGPDEAWRLRGDVAALRAGIDRFMKEPRFVRIVVGDADGQHHPVTSGVIPVFRLEGPRQLRMGFDVSSRTQPQALVVPASHTDQLALPLD